MKKRHLVAVCDILGFKSLFDNEMFSLNRLYKQLGNISSAIGNSVYKDFYPFPIELKRLRKISPLGITWFSDTVLLFTKEDTDKQVVELINCVGHLIGINMLFKETRLRAGISYGEAIMDDSNEIYLGKPLIEAYQLEQMQKWAGGALTSAAEQRIKNINDKEVKNWLISYNVPVAENNCKKMMAINWTHYQYHPSIIKWIGGRDQPSLEEVNSKKEIVLKWRNTNKFHNEVCKTCK